MSNWVPQRWARRVWLRHGLRRSGDGFQHRRHWTVGGAALLTVWAVAAAMSGASPMRRDPQRLDLVNPRVVVLKSHRRLYLFDGTTLVRTYRVALGFAPVGQKRRQGDGCTPEGVFRVCTKNGQSKYHRFLGIGYPDVAAAQRGLRSGLISPGEYGEIVSAQAQNRCPSWTTALGGGVGLHGHGSAGDWTAGCIALSDRDIDELFGVLRLGDTVEVLP